MAKTSKKGKKQVARPTAGVPDALVAAIAILFTFGLRSFAGPCVHDDGSAAACTMTGHVLFGLGIASIALSVLRILSADYHTKRSFDLFLVIAGILIALSPGTVLPLCMMETMHCQAIMLPFARIMGGLMAVAALACEFLFDHQGR